MRNETTPDGDDALTASDLESLQEREDVEVRETTRVHEDEDHCAADNDGRAVVGVVNDDGEVLTLVHDDGEIPPVLPNETVASGDDWTAAGRERVEHLTDLPVEIDGPERVRRVGHVAEGDDEPHATSREVVFRASPATDDLSISHGCDWRGEWLDELPDDAASDEGPAEADIRLFTD